jgi:hypothetical protein
MSAGTQAGWFLTGVAIAQAFSVVTGFLPLGTAVALFMAITLAVVIAAAVLEMVDIQRRTR